MTTLPLAGDLLTAYNNLPAIPANDPLGDIINQLYTTAANPPRVLTAAPNGTNADYDSIEDALAAAAALTPPPSFTSPVTIFVAPGTFIENNPLQLNEGVYLQTMDAAAIGSVTVVAANAAQPVFQINQNRAGLAGFVITGGSIGILSSLANATDSCYITRCFVTGCLTGITHTQGFAVYLDNQILRTSGVMTRSASITGGQLIAVATQFGGIPGQTIAEAVVADGAGVNVRLATVTISDSTQGAQSLNGAELRLTASSLIRCVNGVSVNASVLEADGVQIQEHAASAVDLEVIGSTSRVFWTGGQLSADRFAIEPTATTIMGAPTFRGGGEDPGFQIIGELSVGTETIPRESIFGEGDSHQRGLAVFTNTNGEAGTWADETTEFTDPTTSVDLFPGVAANNSWYIGGDIVFSSMKMNMDAAIALGAGAIVFEYWDGAAWTAFDQMSTTADAPYDAYGNVAFERASQNEQYRFDPDILTGWTQKDLNGTTKFWIRVRVSVAITTSPSCFFSKLGTNRTEINGDGFMEYFGTGEPRRDLRVHQRLSDDLQGASPANASLALTSNITITPIDNHFQDGALDGFGMVIPIPEGIDTSRDIVLEVLWAPNTNNTGDVQLEVNYGLVQEGDTLDGSLSDVNLSQIITVPLNDDDVVRKQTYVMRLPQAVPGNFLCFSLFRDAQLTNPNDTLVGNIKIASLRAFATFWH